MKKVLQKYFSEISSLWITCSLVNANFFLVLINYMYYKMHGKNIFTSGRVNIYGVRNINTFGGRLKVGLSEVGFVDRYDRTLLRIRGSLHVYGKFSIGKGCRIDIGPNAKVYLKSGNLNPNSKIIIMHGLEIGDKSIISWGCEILDDDFHSISYSGRLDEKSKMISIGEHVWVGSNVTILKGSKIPNGSVVASGSLVCSQFHEENILIGGNPARVLRHEITWD